MSTILLEKAQRFAEDIRNGRGRTLELAEERIGLLNRLAEIEAELISSVSGSGNSGDLMNSGEMSGETNQASTPAPAPAATPAKRGRPRKEGIVVVGKKKVVEKSNLPTLLAEIAEGQKKPLKLGDFVQLARHSGYKTKAEDFPNMVYQALLKLVKKGVLERDQESRDYHFVKAA